MRIAYALPLAVIISATTLIAGCGRTPSRLMGRDHAQVLLVPHMKEAIGVSFHKGADDDSTIKDVTFMADDGYVYTQEYKDVSPLEGVIRWVPNAEDASVWRTRGISRWTGTPVNYSLPEDCERVLSVTVHTDSDDKRVKNLTYVSKTGGIFSKEYREGVIDRQFEGWLEIKRKP